MRIQGIIGLIALSAAVWPAWADTSTPPAADQKQVSADYKLQAGDTLRVQIFDEPELDREVTVSQQGEIFLPLIGRLRVKDETLRNVQQAVRVLYDRDYIVNPQVNMMVIKYGQRTVNVMGAVNTPQSIEFPPDRTLTLIDAISRAGGFNRYANRKAVKLTRTYPDGHTENFTINADELISGHKDDNWVLISEDVIFVPESIL